jgi:hypothetical protein
MHPTGPLVLWAVVAIACAALLTVEGALFLSSRQRRKSGWWLGVSLLLGSLMASGLAERLFAIRAGLIYGPPLQGTDPRITTPLAVATVLLSALLVLTAYGSVRALRLVLSIVRSAAAPVTEGSEARAWSFSWSLFVLGVWADMGAWITANGVTGLAATRSSMSLPYTPFACISLDVCLPPGLVYSITAICGAVMFILPLSLLLVVLRRPGRAFSHLVERWLSVAAVAIVLAAFSAAADDELASFLFSGISSDLWGNLEVLAWFLAGYALVIAGVYGVREKLRGSGMPQ